MKQELKTKWIESLRSGAYKQGYYALRTFNNNYCPLGVLYDIQGMAWYLNDELGSNYRTIYNSKYGLSSNMILEWGLNYNDINDIILLNDKNGVSSIAIADWIEDNIVGE